ncbi:hypothetical protein HHI36_013062, partial [Cryptolaemus montrouzieri]
FLIHINLSIMPPIEPTEQQKTRRTILVAKKETLFRRFQKCYDYIKDLKTTVVRSFTVLNSLENSRMQLMKVVADINLLELEIDSNFKPNYQCIESADELYGHILDAAKQLSNKNSSTSSPPILSPSTLSAKVELPKMELVDFSGDPKTWPILYENFKSS